MRAFFSILMLDLRSLVRDQFLFMVFLIAAVAVGLIMVAGVNKQAWGIVHLTQWIPYVIIFSIITNPSSFGMMFGLPLIEEAETRVRAALLVAPLPPVQMILMRMPLVWVALTCVALFLAVGVNSTWQAVELAWFEWLALCVAAAFIGPVAMIVISALASNRVEALALGKFIGVMTAPGALLYLTPPDALYRWLLFVFPTAPIIEAYEAFRAGASGAAWLWLGWAMLYIAALIALSVRLYLRRSYRITA